MYCNERGTSIHLRNQVKRQHKICIYVGNRHCDWQLIVTASDYNEISKAVIASCITRINLASLFLLSKGRTPWELHPIRRHVYRCGYSAPVRRPTHATNYAIYELIKTAERYIFQYNAIQRGRTSSVSSLIDRIVKLTTTVNLRCRR